MIEQYSFSGDDFKVLFTSRGWKIGFLRYSERFSEFDQLERHNNSDEAFILLSGEATIYTDDDICKMEKCVLYDIPKGVWHHITVSEDATVMVVENSDTSGENTEKKAKN